MTDDRPQLRVIDPSTDSLIEEVNAETLGFDEALAEDDQPTREEMLEAIPLHIQIADDVDLDAEDPSLRETGRRQCVAVRQAGGRCLAPPALDSFLCNAHAGRLDASAGGRAVAERRRQRRETEEQRERRARLGTRALIADTLLRQADKVERTVEVLLQAAAGGDLQAAKAVIPYLNQGLGMPTETVQMQTPTDVTDLRSRSTEELQALLARRRTRAAQDAVKAADEAAAASE